MGAAGPSGGGCDVKLVFRPRGRCGRSRRRYFPRVGVGKGGVRLDANLEGVDPPQPASRMAGMRPLGALVACVALFALPGCAGAKPRRSPRLVDQRLC
jgi:hypothetical protein